MDNSDIQSGYRSLVRNIANRLFEDAQHHENCISLTANENYPSFHVRSAHNFVSSSFYDFQPPVDNYEFKTFYPRSEAVDRFNAELISLGNEIFGTKYFDWRPNGGEGCEHAVLFGLCGRGDGIVHFSRSDGGHFALDGMAEQLGVNSYYFKVKKDSLLIDAEALSETIKKHPEIRVVMLDQSNKLRMQDIKEIRRALPKDVVLSYDASHDGLFIATGTLPNPIDVGADIIHGSTHKTIPGPQKGYVGYADSRALCDKISPCVFPKLQSNCHSELLINFYVTLLEIKYFGASYALQTKLNAKRLAKVLAERGFNVRGDVFGYTQTNQVHVAIGDWARTDFVTREFLNKGGIRTNNVVLSEEDNIYGFRLGVQSATRRGLKEKDFDFVAEMMYRLIFKNASPETIKAAVQDYMSKFKLFPLPYSFDEYMTESDLYGLFLPRNRCNSQFHLGNDLGSFYERMENDAEQLVG